MDTTPAQAAHEIRIAQCIADTLDKAYPGHKWAANADYQTGIVQVVNLHLSGRWGFLLKLHELKDDIGLKQVIRNGGELLERYRLSRGAFRQDEYEELRTDSLGNFMADH